MYALLYMYFAGSLIMNVSRRASYNAYIMQAYVMLRIIHRWSARVKMVAPRTCHWKRSLAEHHMTLQNGSSMTIVTFGVFLIALDVFLWMYLMFVYTVLELHFYLGGPYYISARIHICGCAANSRCRVDHTKCSPTCSCKSTSKSTHPFLRKGRIPSKSNPPPDLASWLKTFGVGLFKSIVKCFPWMYFCLV